MHDPGITPLIDRLVGFDPDVAERDELGARLRDLNRIQGWVDHAKVRCSRRLAELSAAGRSESAANALMDEGRRSGKEARAIEERERICSEFPELEDALATGAVSTDHLDALNRMTRNLYDAERSGLHAIADDIVGSATNDWVSSGTRRHVRDVRTPALHHRLLPMPHPSRHLVDERRSDRARQPPAVVRDAPSRGTRGRLEPPVGPRHPGGRLVPARRNDLGHEPAESATRPSGRTGEAGPTTSDVPGHHGDRMATTQAVLSHGRPAEPRQLASPVPSPEGTQLARYESPSLPGAIRVSRRPSTVAVGVARAVMSSAICMYPSGL